MNNETKWRARVRKLVITQNITLDGAVEMLGDWFDPLVQDDELLEETHRQDERADAMLLGRRTFEDFRRFWPAQTDDTTGITAYLNSVAKYVVSTTLTDPGWERSTVWPGDPVAHVEALKAERGLDIVLTGSISLAHTLIAANVVDEFRLSVYPVVQGRGRQLFPDGYELANLRPTVPARTFSSGVTLLQYAVI